MMVLSLFAHDRRVCAVLDFHQAIQITVRPIKGGLEMGRNGIFPASIDPRKNISAFVASMEKSRLSEIKFIAGAR